MRELKSLRAFLLVSLWLPIGACMLRAVLDYYGVTHP